MCGICGIWGADLPDQIEKMLVAMAHRGPDDNGVFVDSTISLGMTRLAIIDVSPAGHQPMSNPEGTVWIVFNGEIYNFQSERDILEEKGYTFRSGSDTEVIIRMYEYYGDDFLIRLRGMFALAIYDKRNGHGKERVLIARDHMGIKPLLYAHVGKYLVFASELKAMLSSGMISRDIDVEALHQLLAIGSIYQPRTMLQSVKMLPPAHRIILENGYERVEQYWTLGLSRHPHMRDLSYEEVVETLTETLRETVKLQMISDVPLGAFLSGGVDSAVLVAMMTQHVSNQRINTFSVGFEAEGGAFDESADAARTAEHLGTNHHAVLVTGDMVRDHLLNIASGLDQPSIDGVNSYFVSMAAREKVTVAISGTGGDEIFAGYPWFIDMMRFNPDPTKLVARKLLASITQHGIFDQFNAISPYINKARTVPNFLNKYGNLHRIFGVANAAQLMTNQSREITQLPHTFESELQKIDELQQGSAVDRVSALSLRGYMNNQLLRDIDAVSMIHSLEVRVPYLDTQVVDLSLSMAENAKIGNIRGIDKKSSEISYRDSGAKRALIDVGVPLLPEGFDDQPKRGFTMPFGSWLRDPLHEIMVDSLSYKRVQQRGILEFNQVDQVKNDFLAGKVNWTRPWLLMMLELWFQQVID